MNSNIVCTANHITSESESLVPRLVEPHPTLVPSLLVSAARICIHKSVRAESRLSVTAPRSHPGSMTKDNSSCLVSRHGIHLIQVTLRSTNHQCCGIQLHAPLNPPALILAQYEEPLHINKRRHVGVVHLGGLDISIFIIRIIMQVVWQRFH
jgi:hypothetical protein